MYQLFCKRTAVDPNDLSRKREVVFTRVIFAKWAKDCLGLTLQMIGNTVNRDHSSVLHWLKMYDSLLETQFIEFLDLLRRIDFNKMTEIYKSIPEYITITCPFCGESFVKELKDADVL
jgi:hypothetical protein